MQWLDTGFVLSVRRHGETSAIVHLLTAGHGRHAGLVHGGAGRRLRSVLQPGNEVRAAWRARLSEHLGTFAVELERARAAGVLDDPLRLAALAAAAEILDAVLPEREPHPEVFARSRVLLDAIAEAADWPVAYACWERDLLAELGFGLDLAEARGPGPWGVTRTTGRVAPAGQGTLPLPAFLAGAEVPADLGARAAAVSDALVLTGAFLERAATPPGGFVARTRLVGRLAWAQNLV